MLDNYRKKRDFSKTDEPEGGKKKAEGRFVIQKHDARTLHYDFRLEVNGAMPSWAVTKEPNDADRRLAIRTEDHPIEYAKFEGKIPEGQYGAGSVKIWDSGKYKNIRKISMPESIKEGKIEVSLSGKNLNGNYAMIRMKPRGKQEAWLFFRMKT